MKIEGRSSCSCSNHLFEHPICLNQTLLRKIANIVFHLLTLGVPLGVYHAGLLALRVVKVDEGDASSPASRAVEVDEEVIDFAKREVKSIQEPFVFRKGAETMHQPDEELGKLVSRCLGACSELQNLMEEHIVKGGDVWGEKEVLEVADKYIKLSYAVSVITLRNLPKFIEKLKNKELKKRTLVKALTMQDSYNYRTFFYLAKAFSFVRDAKICVKVGESVFFENPLDNENSIRDQYIQGFYTKGTLQRKWFELFNNYGQFVKGLLNESQLNAADERFAMAIQEIPDKRGAFYMGSFPT